MDTSIHMSDDDLKEAIGMWINAHVNFPYETTLIHMHRVNGHDEYKEPEYGALLKLKVYVNE